MKNTPQSSPLDFLQIMSNVRSRTAATDRTYVYIRMPAEGDIYKTREQPTRRAEQRNHIDPEPYTRHGRRVRINKDFPSRTSSRTGEYFKHPPHRPFSCTPPALDHHPRWSPCIIHLLSSSLIAACRLFALLLSRREKHFLSTAPARISWTRAVNFSFPLPYERLSFSPFLLLLLRGSTRCPCPFFPRSHTFYVVFPDMSRGHEYVNPGLGS